MLRSLIIVFFIALLSGQAFGQENEWPISPRHKRKLEKETNKYKRDILLAKYLKRDSAKYGKAAREAKIKLKKALNDSLQSKLGTADISVDSAKFDQAKKKAVADAKDKLAKEYGIPTTKLDSTVVDQKKSELKGIVKDSLNNYIDIPDIAIDSSMVDHTKLALKQEGKQRLQEELGVAIPNVKLDSTAKDQVKTEIKSRGKQALQDELGMDIPDIRLDSAGVAQLADEAEKRALEELKKEGGIGSLEDIPADSELGQLTKYKDQLEQTQQQLKQGMAKQKIKEKMAASAKKFIQENAGQISEVQSKMGELKQKYSYVPNSNDLSTAKKRTSLKGENIWKRLVIGGNFNVSKTNPLRIDLSPVIGYKINKLFEVGLTGAYRTQFKADKTGVTQNGENVYGFSVFVDHMVFKNFFGHLEGERLRTDAGTPENPSREWKETLLVGIGRKFNVAKWLEMQALVLYNPLHDNKDGLYNSPVVFKTGIRVRK